MFAFIIRNTLGRNTTSVLTVCKVSYQVCACVQVLACVCLRVRVYARACAFMFTLHHPQLFRNENDVHPEMGACLRVFARVHVCVCIRLLYCACARVNRMCKISCVAHT